jgi:hypothetical protein
VNFLHFLFRKIHVSPTDIVSSLSPPWYCLSSGRRRHTVTPCHASFPLSQDELAISTSSSSNVLSRRLSSRAETKILNSHHRRKLSSLNHPTHTLYCYKKIISTLTTLSTTQTRLHFTSSLARTPRHWSSTHLYRSLSPMSYAHRSSA